MSDLTKEHFDQQITRVLDTMALKVEVNERFESIETILERHTTTLDGIATNTETWKTEAAALKSAIDRQNRLIKLVAEGTGLNFDELARKAEQN